MVNYLSLIIRIKAQFELRLVLRKKPPYLKITRLFCFLLFK
jgi:hypothetical protein